MKILLIIAMTLVLLYIAAGVLLYIKQRDLLYYPSAPIESGYKSMTIQNGNEKIHITVTNPDKEKALLYWGGNGEAVASGADVFAEALPDYSTYLIDYRGYGKSTGEPTQAGILSDALVIYDAIKSHHKSISLFGRSLGTGVACYVAANKKTDKLVLITPYDSILSVAKDRYFMFPLSLLVKDRYDSLSIAPRIKAKTIMLIAEHDTVVPKEHAYRLAKAFTQSQLEVYELKNTHHNDIADSKAYREALERFFHER